MAQFASIQIASWYTNTLESTRAVARTGELLPFTGAPVSNLAILSVVPQNSTTLRVTYTVTVLNNQALVNIGNYTISPTLPIFGAVAQVANPPVYVDLTVQEMHNGTAYTLNAYRIDASNSMITLMGTFTGLGLLPRVVSAMALNSTTVRVIFSEPMLNNAALVLPANYVITHAMGSSNRTVVSVTPEQLTNPTFVDLTLDGNMTNGTNNYTVTVSSSGPVEVDALNTVDPAHNAATFNGVGVGAGQIDATAVPGTVSNEGGTSVVVTFTNPSALPDGAYKMHVGPLGTSADPIAYSGVSGQANKIFLKLGVFTMIAPALPLGGPYSVTITDLNGGLVGTTSPILTVLPHDFKSATLLLRKLFPSRYATGIRAIDLEEYPQP